MNKKVKELIIIVVLLAVIYLGFKLVCYKKYSREVENITNIKITDKMTINHIDLEDSEYITFENLKFKNIFEGYDRLEEENSYKMVMRKSDGETDKAIFIGYEEPYVITINSHQEYSDLSKYVIKKENINDDIDFIKYLEKHNDDKVKFFMTTKKQKQIYLVNEFKETVLPSIENIIEIDGYYRGYLLNNKAIKQVNILKDNKNYYCSFIGDYTDEFINDFINTLVIE